MRNVLTQFLLNFGFTSEPLQIPSNSHMEYRHGPSHLADKSLKELLDIGNSITRKYRASEEFEAYYDRGFIHDSLFYPGASDEDISRLEERLQTTLPQDFKHFLSLTNGFGARDRFGEEFELGLHDGIVLHPALHNTSQLRWVEEDYFKLPVELLKDLPREYENLVDKEYKQRHQNDPLAFDSPFPLFDRMIEIGATDDFIQLWLVPPGLVKQSVDVYKVMYANADETKQNNLRRAMESLAGSREAFEGMAWCVAKYDAGGGSLPTFYANFKSYVEHTVVGGTKVEVLETARHGEVHDGV